MNKKEQKKAQEALYSAGVPKIYWNSILPDFKAVGEDLRKYVESDVYDEDKEKGIGIFFYGPGKDRDKIFHTLAKELVLLDISVVVISLRRLVNLTIENENIWPGLALVGRCDALFVTGFYDDERFPYTYGEISQVEDVLRGKIENAVGQVFFSSCKRLQHCTWWTKDFKRVVRDRVKEQAIGKSNRSTTPIRVKKNRKL